MDPGPTPTVLPLGIGSYPVFIYYFYYILKTQEGGNEMNLNTYNK